MNDADKKPFLDALITLGDMYDKSESDVKRKSPLYWSALQHYSLDSVKAAMNEHVRDPERGKFYPKPADIIDKMPNAKGAWPDANEAWAMCPKDERTSAAMCEEMTSAYAVCQDLVDYGDMVAARMAFISAYNRNVEMAIAEGKAPVWFPSYGDDKAQRYHADREIVRMKNMSLPQSERLRLPDMPVDEVISLEQLSEKAPVDSEKAKQNISKILEMLKE